MLRREFLKTSGAVVAGTALPGVAFGAEPVAAGRVILPINRGWRRDLLELQASFAQSNGPRDSVL